MTKETPVLPLDYTSESDRIRRTTEGDALPVVLELLKENKELRETAAKKDAEWKAYIAKNYTKDGWAVLGYYLMLVFIVLFLLSIAPQK